jgi:fatty-acyl-CoA synthase
MSPDTEPGVAPRNNVAHVAGPLEPPLLVETVPSLLARTVKQHGDLEAAVFCEAGVRWTYRELSQQVDRLAAGLLALGLYKGDRIGIWAPNRPEWLLTQFATARIGLIMVNINPAYRRAELEYALNKVGAKALITAANFKTSDYIEMLADLAPELQSATPGHLRSERLPHLRTVIQLGEQAVSGTFQFDEVMKLGDSGQSSRLDAISQALSPHDPINIQFTSGTTGAPKGATLTHQNIVNNARFTVNTMGFSHEDRLCIPVPLYHCFGMVMGTLGCATCGATMVFPAEAFDPESTLTALAEERCTALYAVPTMFVAQLDHANFGRFDLSSLRTGVMAGAPCPIEVMKRVVSDMHMDEVTIAYGMTETSPVSFQSHVDDPIDKRVATVGRIHPHVEVKVITDKGAVAGVGESGELCTRGYSVMRGYWDEAELTAEAIDADGWMHTGDLATIDAEGYCNIVGRVKDMLIRGGENVYPREVEEYLFRHPKVQEVQVFGVPDERYGEEICAWVVLKAGEQAQEEEISEFCKGQIAHFKIPRHIRFKTELPMTVTGKPQKFKMREEMMTELGLTETSTA